MKPTILKICKFSTIHLYEWMRDYKDEKKMPYDENKLKLIESSFDKVAQSWLKDVFGNAAGLKSKEFLEKATNEGKWLFKPNYLRKKIFGCAGIPDVHAY